MRSTRWPAIKSVLTRWARPAGNAPSPTSTGPASPHRPPTSTTRSPDRPYRDHPRDLPPVDGLISDKSLAAASIWSLPALRRLRLGLIITSVEEVANGTH